MICKQYLSHLLQQCLHFSYWPSLNKCSSSRWDNRRIAWKYQESTPTPQSTTFTRVQCNLSAMRPEQKIYHFNVHWTEFFKIVTFIHSFIWSRVSSVDVLLCTIPAGVENTGNVSSIYTCDRHSECVVASSAAGQRNPATALLQSSRYYFKSKDCAIGDRGSKLW